MKSSASHVTTFQYLFLCFVDERQKKVLCECVAGMYFPPMDTTIAPNT